MHVAFVALNPQRPPNWRAERALEMVRHRPHPLWPTSYDDTYIRRYRWLLLEYAAGEYEPQRQIDALEYRPPTFAAHRFFYSPDIATRQLLEAWLLTSETFAQIAARFGTDAETIEHFEALFYSVRDRLKHLGWVRHVVRGKFNPFSRPRTPAELVEQRGYVWRFFAVAGGPLVLEALSSGGFSPAPPASGAEVGPWMSASTEALIQILAAGAASSITLDQATALKIMRLAATNRRDELRRQAQHKDNRDTGEISEEYWAEVLHAIRVGMRDTPELRAEDQAHDERLAELARKS